MLDIQFNRKLWNDSYAWDGEGEEWSRICGSSEAQWFCSIYPRIHRYLPANAIIEIAPGFGRWTQFFLPQCNKFNGVDLSDKCIKHCRSIFTDENVQFFVNDGKSRNFIKENSVDFVFSFDSLVKGRGRNTGRPAPPAQIRT